jgi:hypothetical protein
MYVCMYVEGEGGMDECRAARPGLAIRMLNRLLKLAREPR